MNWEQFYLQDVLYKPHGNHKEKFDSRYTKDTDFNTCYKAIVIKTLVPAQRRTNGSMELTEEFRYRPIQMDD